MEDVTDPSFRRLCKEFGADMVTTEFVSSDGLFHGAEKTFRKLNVSDEELAKRRAEWKPIEPKITTGYLARYAKLVSSGAQGAVLS